jgi:cytoskeleton protein RodZ
VVRCPACGNPQVIHVAPDRIVCPDCASRPSLERSADAPAPPTGAEVGEKLRTARLARGVRLDQAAKELGIEPGFLKALEADAGAYSFPDPVYGRLFLREYARYLGLKPGPLVRAYGRRHPETERPVIGGPSPVERRRGRFLGAALVAGSVAGLLVLAGSSIRDAIEHPPLAVTEYPSPAASPTVVPTESPPDAPPLLQVRVEGGTSWLRVTREDRVLVEGTYPAGFRQSFRLRPSLSLEVGNAGAIRLKAAGERLPALGAAGEVYVGEVRLRDGDPRLLPRP